MPGRQRMPGPPWSPLSCGKVPTGGRNHTGQGPRVAGGGAPGWRPRPLGLVGAGLGVEAVAGAMVMRGDTKSGGF